MAVLIQDMELPESCADCRFLKFDHLSPGCSVAFCLACSQVIPDEDRERPDWCPLKHVSDSASDDTLIRELREYAELYRSGENLGHEIQDTDIPMSEAANRLEHYVKTDVRKNNDAKDAEGVCPVRGGQVLYTGRHELDDSGGAYWWACPQCGASGEEGYNRAFDRHYNVADKDGNPIPGRPE